MESINPNDIFNLDISTISLITLKNGDMLLIDNTIPEKGINHNTISNKLDSNESYNIKKIFEISPPIILFFEGKIIKNKNKNDFNICSKITKNINLFFEGIKNNLNILYNLNNFNSKNSYNPSQYIESEKEINSMNNKNNINYNLKKNSKLFSFRPLFIENDKTLIKYNTEYSNTNINSTENSNYLSKNEKIDFNINLKNISNIKNDNIENNKNNTSVNINSFLLKKKYSSKKHGKEGYLRKNRNSINPVCSLSIGACEPNKINLVNKFNNIVDKLNNQREKNKKNNEIKNENKNKSLIYYKFYKHNDSSINLKKNIESFNNIKDINSDIIDDVYIKKISNNKKKKNNNKNSFNSLSNYNSNENSINHKNYRKSFANLPSQQYNYFKDKMRKYSLNIILPSNKMLA